MTSLLKSRWNIGWHRIFEVENKLLKHFENMERTEVADVFSEYVIWDQSLRVSQTNWFTSYRVAVACGCFCWKNTGIACSKQLKFVLLIIMILSEFALKNYTKMKSSILLLIINVDLILRWQVSETNFLIQKK